MNVIRLVVRQEEANRRTTRPTSREPTVYKSTGVVDRTQVGGGARVLETEVLVSGTVGIDSIVYSLHV